jgi:hypothetical protein
LARLKSSANPSKSTTQIKEADLGNRSRKSRTKGKKTTPQNQGKEQATQNKGKEYLFRFVDAWLFPVVLNFNARVRGNDRRSEHHTNKGQGN